MATGTVTLFEEFTLQLGSENHILTNGGDVIKLGLIDNTTAPTAGDTSPTWSDYSANEVGTGGGYTADGVTLANQSYTEAAGTATFNADDVSFTQNASGFTDAYWGIIYNSTNASDMAIGFVELGGPVSEVAGPVTISWNENGIFTVAKA
jgi:hypothetical protein